jgi:hypothetical protein
MVPNNATDPAALRTRHLARERVGMFLQSLLGHSTGQTSTQAVRHLLNLREGDVARTPARTINSGGWAACAGSEERGNSTI